MLSDNMLSNNLLSDKMLSESYVKYTLSDDIMQSEIIMLSDNVTIEN
jgi:hypothetical protein